MSILRKSPETVNILCIHLCISAENTQSLYTCNEYPFYLWKKSLNLRPDKAPRRRRTKNMRCFFGKQLRSWRRLWPKQSHIRRKLRGKTPHLKAIPYYLACSTSRPCHRRKQKRNELSVSLKNIGSPWKHSCGYAPQKQNNCESGRC